MGARSGSLFYPLLTALAMVLQMIGGSLQVTGITVLAMFPYSIFLMVSPGKDKKPTFLPFLQLILALMLSVGLYAFQLFPTLELSSEAFRGTQAGWEIASSFSFPAASFYRRVVPDNLRSMARRHPPSDCPDRREFLPVYRPDPAVSDSARAIVEKTRRRRHDRPGRALRFSGARKIRSVVPDCFQHGSVFRQIPRS